MGFVDIPHAAAAEQHALKRLFQRRGIALGRVRYRELSAMCADGRFPVAAKARAGSTIHRVKVDKGIEVWAIFDRSLGLIVTFLPGNIQT